MSRYGDEAVQAMEWVYAALTGSQAVADALAAIEGHPVTPGDVEDRVWPEPAPSGTPYPFLTYSVAESLDTLAVGDEARIMSSVPMIVKAVDKARGYDRMAPLARAAYAAVHGHSNVPVADGGVMLSARRTGGIQYPEQGAGIEYRHLGHRLMVEIN